MVKSWRLSLRIRRRSITIRRGEPAPGGAGGGAGPPARHAARAPRRLARGAGRRGEVISNLLPARDWRTHRGTVNSRVHRPGVFCFSPRSKSAHAAARRLRQAQRVEHGVRAMSSYSSGRPRARAARPREPAIGPALRAGRRAGLASAARLLRALARALGGGEGGELLVRVRFRVRVVNPNPSPNSISDANAKPNPNRSP